MKYSSLNIKITKLMMYLITDGRKRAKYLKKHCVFKEMGEKCYYHTRDIPAEPYLLKMGNNVKIAANVRMITHDIISTVVNEMPEYKGNNELPYYLGKIEIGDNVMIGANSTILYNTKIGSNSIIAAGSVVVKDVPEGMVVGGNPAKVICTLDEFIEKRRKLPSNPPKKSEGIDKIIDYYWNDNK